VLKWAGITFGVGIALIIVDLYMASKNKGGITPTDRQRMWGILWVTCIMTALVAGLIWMAE
jgi:hypothetical protein